MEIEKLKMKDSKEKEDEIQKIEEDESTVLDFSVKNDQVSPCYGSNLTFPGKQTYGNHDIHSLHHSDSYGTKKLTFVPSPI